MRAVIKLLSRLLWKIESSDATFSSLAHGVVSIGC